MLKITYTFLVEKFEERDGSVISGTNLVIISWKTERLLPHIVVHTPGDITDGGGDQDVEQEHLLQSSRPP